MYDAALRVSYQIMHILIAQARLQDAQHQPAEALRTLARAQAAASAASAARDASAAERYQVLQVQSHRKAIILFLHFKFSQTSAWQLLVECLGICRG